MFPVVGLRHADPDAPRRYPRCGDPLDAPTSVLSGTTSGMIRVKPFPLSGTDAPKVDPRQVMSAARIFNMRAKTAKSCYGMPLATKESVRWKKNSR